MEDFKYQLTLDKDLPYPDLFLCYLVQGFSSLWASFIGGFMYPGCSLTNYLVVRYHLPQPRAEARANAIRARITSMLPCTMTVSELRAIIEEEVTK